MEKKMFKSLIVSMIFMYMATTIGVFVDGIVIGGFLGDDAMASYGLSAPLLTILLAVTDVFASGGQNVCAGEMGKGNMKRANQAFSAVIAIILAVAVVMSVLILIFLNPICEALGATGSGANLFEGLRDYVKGLAFSLPAMFIALVITMIQQLEGYMAPTIAGVITMTSVNIALDFGNVYVVKGGMFGMATATTISYYCGMIVLLLGFLKKGLMFRLSFHNLSFQDIRKVLTIGLPGALERVCYAVRGMVYNKLLLVVALSAVAGTMAVASYTVFTTLNNLFGSVCFGVESATLMVVGILFGEENRPAMKRLLGSSMKWMVILTTAAGAVLFMIAPFVVGFFSDNPETRGMSVKCVRIFCLSMPFTGANASLKKFLQGTRRINLTNAYCVLEIVVITSAVGAALGFSFGVYGVFYGYLVAEALMLVVYALVCLTGKKADGFLFLPKDFDVPSEDCYEGNVHSIEEVSDIAESTAQFCRDHGASERQVMVISLSVEEMAGNIINHGFSDGKNHHMEYRLVYKKGGFALRFRDDCRRFNPVDWMQEIQSEEQGDKEHHIGIRLVANMVKDIQYVNSMSTNNTIIKI